MAGIDTSKRETVCDARSLRLGRDRPHERRYDEKKSRSSRPSDASQASASAPNPPTRASSTNKPRPRLRYSIHALFGDCAARVGGDATPSRLWCLSAPADRDGRRCVFESRLRTHMPRDGRANLPVIHATRTPRRLPRRRSVRATDGHRDRAARRPTAPSATRNRRHRGPSTRTRYGVRSEHQRPGRTGTRAAAREACGCAPRRVRPNRAKRRCGGRRRGQYPAHEGTRHLPSPGLPLSPAIGARSCIIEHLS